MTGAGWVARAVAGLAGLAVWILGILAYTEGREVAGTLEIVLGGVLMSLALFDRVPNPLRAFLRLIFGDTAPDD